MKLCTLALGEKHLRLAERLRDSLPVPLEIRTNLPDNIPVRAGGPYDHHNKVFLLEEACEEAGTLYLDADAICVDRPALLSFLGKLRVATPGIHSPYVFSAYGWHFPKLPEGALDRRRLTPVLRLIDGLLPLAEKDLREFRMPHEWMMFVRFVSPAQQAVFFTHFRKLHRLLIKSACTLGNDCNLIGLAAQHCGLPVLKLSSATGMRHKQ